MQKLLTVKEVAEILGTSPWQIYNMIRQGKFPKGVVVRCGRSIRFNPAAFQRWLEEGGNEWNPERAAA